MELPNVFRRKFLMLPAYAASTVLVSSPVRASVMNALVLNVKPAISDDLAAYADGRKDATNAIQSLVDLCSRSGEVVNIPKGFYLIDAGKGVRLRNGTRLKMDPETRLIALPERSGNYAIIKVYGVHGVSIEGGMIVGERNDHIGSGGEWGFGIDVKGSTTVHISNISVSGCWGDGFYVGSESRDVTLDNVISFKNRRQGLSITSCDRISVVNSKFMSTSGTAPSAGIDIEPNKGEKVSNVIIRNCEIRDNAGCGILTWNDTANLEIFECTIVGNKIYGIYLKGAVSGVEISGNLIKDNKMKNLNIGDEAVAVKIDGKVYSSN